MVNMTSPLTIRPALKVDHQVLLNIIWQTVLVDPVGNAEIIANPDAVELPIEQLDARTACVAELDGSPIGFATVVPRPDRDAELDGLFVLPGLQRTGVGRALVAAARDLAVAQGAGRLCVVANPDAQAFYLAIGFLDAGVTTTRFGTAPLMTLSLR